jgi:hypothetical protein
MAKSISVADPSILQRETRTNPLLEWVFEHVEERPQHPAPMHQLPYQHLLRALGAWLDTNNACNVNLIETPAGFTIRYGVGTEALLLCKYILTHAELEHLEASMRERRSHRPSGRYQDFLRALGYEIDRQAGACIVLDEIEESFFLTFFQASEGGGLASIKRARLLNPDDRAAILRRARARRNQPKVPQRFWDRIWRRQRSLPPVAQA